MDEASGGASVTNTTGTGTNFLPPRGRWRPEEDEKLRQLVEQYGPQNWNSIADKIQGRSVKSCRFRWFTHLDPNNRKPFPEEEEENASLFGKRRSHNFISSSAGNITMSNFLTKPSTADTINSGLCKEIKDGFLVFPQQMAAASWAFPASEITGTSSMGSFLTLSSQDCRNGNELSSYGESSAGPQKFRVINEETEESCTMHENVGFIDFLGVGTPSKNM